MFFLIELGLYSLPIAAFVWFIASLVLFICHKGEKSKPLLIQLIISGALSLLILVGAVAVIGFLIYTFLTTPMTGM